MNSDVKSRVLLLQERSGLFHKGDKIVIGISGGVDSVCLFLVLRELKEEFGLSLFAVHVNHGIRREADDDEQFVKDLCEEDGTPFRAFRFDVPAEAERLGCGLEEAGRIMRRQAFEEAAREWGCNKIALAHHSGDQAETILLHLLRGAGARGLSGIRPVQGMYIRPLLTCTKEEIVSFVTESGMQWRHDASNDEETFRRNYVRRTLIPLLQEEVNARAPEHICEAGERVAELYEYVDKDVRKAYRSCVTEKKGAYRVSEKKWKKLDPLIGKLVLKRAAESCAGTGKDLAGVHTDALTDLMRGGVSRRICLPQSVAAEKTYDGIRLIREANAQSVSEEAVPGVIEVKTFPAKKKDFPRYIKEKTYTKYFDCDIIYQIMGGKFADPGKGLAVRTRRPEDRIEIDDKGSRKKVSDIFIDKKIPKAERGSIPLLVCGDEVLWIIGMRINRRFRVTRQTKTVLKVKYRRESYGYGFQGTDQPGGS